MLWLYILSLIEHIAMYYIDRFDIIYSTHVMDVTIPIVWNQQPRNHKKMSKSHQQLSKNDHSMSVMIRLQIGGR